MNTPPESLASLAARWPAYDAENLRVDVAQALLRQLSPAPSEIQLQPKHLPLRQALGRVLAEAVISPLQVPPFNNSAMDGYALRGSDLRAGASTRLRVMGTRLAGPAGAAEIASGQCQRIMTGAMLPTGLDTVVPQERVERVGEHIHIPAGTLAAGANCRLAGEDLALGAVALQQGRKLRAADIGLLASLGLSEVAVWPRLRVAILSTGNELCEPGQDLTPGCRYDSNRHTLAALLEGLGVEVLDFGAVPDQPAALRQALARAAEEADVIISSGGVSAGEADHTRAVMAELGELLYWRLAMRPGRPLAVGRIQRTQQNKACSALLFGLPGNPVAMMVSFYAFVREALLSLSGATPEPLLTLQAISPQGLRKKPGRTEFQRGLVSPNAAGQWQVTLTGDQGSGILSSMSQANGLVVLGHEQGDVAAGDWVTVWPLAGLG